MGRSVPGRPARPGGPPDREAVATRRRRAAEEPLDVRLRAREPFVDLDVRNPIHRTSYRVVFPEYPRRDSALCTCTDFARRGLGTCKHVEAAWGWLHDAQEGSTAVVAGPTPVRTDGLWPGIERQLQRLTRSPPTEIREVEAAGELLYAPEEERTSEGTEGPEEVGRSASRRVSPRSTSRGRP